MTETKTTTIVTETVLVRKLSLKSKLNFGDNGHLTVQDVIYAGREADLVWAYYNLSKISFIDEVLDLLGIEPEKRIAKPGKDPETGDEIIRRFEVKAMEDQVTTKKNEFIKRFIGPTKAIQKLK